MLRYTIRLPLVLLQFLIPLTVNSYCGDIEYQVAGQVVDSNKPLQSVDLVFFANNDDLSLPFVDKSTSCTTDNRGSFICNVRFNTDNGFIDKYDKELNLHYKQPKCDAKIEQLLLIAHKEGYKYSRKQITVGNSTMIIDFGKLQISRFYKPGQLDDNGKTPLLQE